MSTLPILLYPPNLIGYVRVVTLILAMADPNPTSTYAFWCLFTSLFLDYFDGPVARRLNMCTQFGDLLDHFTDHATMLWVVYITASNSSLGMANLGVSVVHNVVAFIYMCYRGHYFKHTEKGNTVTRMIEANNYWNPPSSLYAANCIIIPMIKISYAEAMGVKAADATTMFVDLIDFFGAWVTASYTVAVLMDRPTSEKEK
mmetsp:Transcript_124050/g.194423  ORF Transcript_124050/g.194423 Transcript_124050/m.194423 type:complete len:201 (-) Transcript_124050:111-713(-)